MADAGRGGRERGKSDSTDADAVASGVARRPRQAASGAAFGRSRARPAVAGRPPRAAVRQRVAPNNTLQGICTTSGPSHAAWRRAVFDKGTCIARRLGRAEQSTRVRIARDEAWLREPTQTINSLEAEIAALVRSIAPQLLFEPGFGPLTAAGPSARSPAPAASVSDAKLASLRRNRTPPHRSQRTPTATASTAAATARSTRPSTASPSPVPAATPKPSPTSPARPPKARPTAKPSAPSSATFARWIWHLLQPAPPSTEPLSLAQALT